MDFITQTVNRHRREMRSTFCNVYDDDDRAILETTFNYIYADPPIAMGWGASDFMATTYKNMLGLRFTVNGFKFAGKVIVAYDRGKDYYKIFLGDAGKYDLIAEDVFCGALVATIDRAIETDDADGADYRAAVGGFIDEQPKEVQIILQSIFGK